MSFADSREYKMGREKSRIGLWQRLQRPSTVGVGFVTPAVILISIVIVIPIIMSIYYSFTRFNLLGTPQWAGLDNYVRLLDDADFIRSLWQTLLYTVMTVPVQTFLSLLVASILARRFRNRRGSFVRAVLFIPVIASLVLSGMVWRYLLAYDGVINSMLGIFGVPPTDWLGQSSTALGAIAIVTVWKNVGYFLVIYYAGILEVPEELYEASALDGAGSTRQFFSITLPSLRPITLLVLVLGTIWSFQVFDLIYSMTGGGPGGSTSTLVYEIYQTGFREFDMGYASAMSVILFLIILVASVFQRIALSRR